MSKLFDLPPRLVSQPLISIPSLPTEDMSNKLLATPPTAKDGNTEPTLGPQGYQPSLRNTCVSFEEESEEEPMEFECEADASPKIRGFVDTRMAIDKSRFEKPKSKKGVDRQNHSPDGKLQKKLQQKDMKKKPKCADDKYNISNVIFTTEAKHIDGLKNAAKVDKIEVPELKVVPFDFYDSLNSVTET